MRSEDVSCLLPPPVGLHVCSPLLISSSLFCTATTYSDGLLHMCRRSVGIFTVSAIMI